MPSSMTHTYFSLDVYHKLNKKYQEKINLDYLKIFAQGSDPFIFYNFLIGPKSKYYKNIQHLMHTSKTKDFFLNLITYIHDNNLITNKEVMSYLYGYICHYHLDLETHPYIFYKTGIFNKKDKSTYKYNALHQQMEYVIDMYYISKKESIPPKKFKIHDNIFKFHPFSSELTQTINYTISKTYNISNITPSYIKSIKDMHNFFKFFNYDPTSIKKIIYTIVDYLTPSSIINIKELSYSNNYQDYISYLNLDKLPWNYPWDKNKTFNYSFIELYDIALSKAVKTITEITNILNNKVLNQTKVKKLFPNLSYITGKDCNLNLEFVYFDN